MKKYNSIMEVFTKTVTKLENLATKNADSIAKKTAAIKVLKSEAQLLDEELTAAMTSAEKIKEFLGE
jgi:capsule polysaccharide export protein KpsE/RkpR